MWTKPFSAPVWRIAVKPPATVRSVPATATPCRCPIDEAWGTTAARTHDSRATRGKRFDPLGQLLVVAFLGSVLRL